MRYLLLAEGFSGDPLYAKTMRGVLRYRREDVVAILDSTRVGETDDGVPIVATVDEALPLEPAALKPGLTRDEVMKELDGHVKVATGLIGTFQHQ